MSIEHMSEQTGIGTGGLASKDFDNKLNIQQDLGAEGNPGGNGSKFERNYKNFLKELKSNPNSDPQEIADAEADLSEYIQEKGQNTELYQQAQIQADQIFSQIQGKSPNEAFQILNQQNPSEIEKQILDQAQSSGVDTAALKDEFGGMGSYVVEKAIERMRNNLHGETGNYSSWEWNPQTAQQRLAQGQATTSQPQGGGGIRNVWDRIRGRVTSPETSTAPFANTEPSETSTPPPNIPEGPRGPQPPENGRPPEYENPPQSLDDLMDRIVELNSLSNEERERRSGELALYFSDEYLGRFAKAKKVDNKSPQMVAAEAAIQRKLAGPITDRENAIERQLPALELMENEMEELYSIEQTLESKKDSLKKYQDYLSESELTNTDRTKIEEIINEYKEQIAELEDEDGNPVGDLVRIRAEVSEAASRMGWDDLPDSQEYKSWKSTKKGIEDDELDKLKRRVNYQAYLQEKQAEKERSQNEADKERLEHLPALDSLGPILDDEGRRRNIDEAGLERYFYEARRLGITSHWDALISNLYSTYHDLKNPRAERELKSFLNQYKATSREEEEIRLNGISLNGVGLTPEQIRQFRGIGELFIERAQNRLIIERDNLFDPSHRIEWPRRIGEWDFDAASRGTGKERMYDDDTFRITLNTDSLENFKLGIDQFVDKIIFGSSRFDANDVLRQMERLSSAIQQNGKELEARGIFHPDDINSELKKITQQAEIRLYLYTAQFFAVRGLTMELIAVMDRFSDNEGPERLKHMPAMKGGRVGLGMAILEYDGTDVYNFGHGVTISKREFELMFRTEGHKGQLAMKRDSQKFLVDQFQDRLIKKLMMLQIKGAGDEKLSEANLGNLSKEMSLTQFMDQFEVNPLMIPVRELEEEYKLAKADWARAISPEEKTSRKAALDEVEARLDKAKKEVGYENIAKEAKDAAELVIQAFDALGIHTKLSAPSFIMGHGDYIRVEDAVAFCKYAILEKMREKNARGGKKRDLASVRAQGKVEANAYKMGDFFSFGLEQDEIAEFKKAFQRLREQGFSATWGEGDHRQRFEDIIKRSDVAYIPNNFLAIDHDVRTRLAGDDVHIWLDILRGKQKWMNRVWTTLHPLEDTQEAIRYSRDDERFQEQLDNWADKIEASRSFHVMVWQMAHAAAVRPNLDDPDSFSVDKLAMGPMNVPLALKRLYLQDYYLNNERERLMRGERIVPAIPVAFYDYEEAMGANNMLEAINIADKGALDSYEMQRFYFQIKDMHMLRSISEGDIDEKSLEKDWGFFEKIFSNANSMFVEYYQLESEKRAERGILDLKRQQVVEDLEKIFNPLKRVFTILEKMYSNDRGGAGSGAGFETQRKLFVIVMHWLASNAPGNSRVVGGQSSYRLISDLIKEDGWLRTEKYVGNNQSLAEALWDRLYTAHKS